MHVFVAMPFGQKQGIDFNAVYSDYIKPALEQAGFEVFRADEETRAGEIRTDMFQELLLADLVVVDLTIDNPNVWYELGVRHALRSRGVIQIMSERDYRPFDVYTDRTLHYHIADGKPDPAHLEADKQALAQFATSTMQAWHGHKVSPVYHLLDGLAEPDWRNLQVAGAKEFWAAYQDWDRRVEVARKRERPGDVMLLADETPTWVLKLEARRRSGAALRSLGRFTLALEQFEKALEMDPTDLETRQQRGILLGRLGKHDEAKEWLEEVVRDHPEDAESWALLGRVEKDHWIESWRDAGDTPEEKRKAAAYEDSLLKEAIEPYATAFRKDPSHYYSGINAVTLWHLLTHLTGDDANAEEYRSMEGGVRWAVECALAKDRNDYWARVTLADLEVLLSDPDVVTRAYKDAVAVADKDWFALDSSSQQLLLLQQLEFRPEAVTAGIEALEHALGRLAKPEKSWEPRKVVLFSGHMIDAPNRPEPRFPASQEAVAAKAIAERLDALEVGSEDLALCGGASGGDILFAEACRERGVRLEVRLPFEEPEFLAKSVSFAGESWVHRFYEVKKYADKGFFIATRELGKAPIAASPFARNNIWQLYSALAWGPEKVHFLALWDGKAGDGLGGTQHMHNEVRKRAGRVSVIDTKTLSTGGGA